MAQKVIVSRTDDLSGDEGASNVAFALDGSHYEIDLGDDNAAGLRGILAPYIAAGRMISTAPRRRRGRAHTRDIREWATARGYTINLRGRVPQAITREYEAERAGRLPRGSESNAPGLPAQARPTATGTGAGLSVVRGELEHRAPAANPADAARGSESHGERPGAEPTAEPTGTPERPGATGSKPPSPADASPADTNRNSAIRAWAKGRGYNVNARGRIPASVVSEYDATHRK